jgi:hypothetical protein
MTCAGIEIKLSPNFPTLPLVTICPSQHEVVTDKSLSN